MYSVPDIKAWAQKRFGGRLHQAGYLVDKVREDGIQPDIISDVGCGTMTMACRVAELMEDSKVVCCDIQKHQSNGGETPSNVGFNLMEPFGFSKQPEKSDVVVLSGVIHHIDQKDEQRFLEDIRAGMTDGPDSRLFVHEHMLSPKALRRRIETICLYVAEFGINVALEKMRARYNFFTRDRLMKLLADSGFNVLHEEDVGRKFVTLPSVNTNRAFWCSKA